ncbi:hypothetical protein ABIE27_006046 [Paenibacillus sp. 4624]
MSKNFDDFRNGFQSLDFELLAEKINDLKINSGIPTTEEGMRQYTTGIMAACMTVTFDLLESYHLWLNSPENEDRE